MPGGKLEGFAPNLLVKVALTYHRHRVGWGHRHRREGHEAVVAFPLATFAFAFALAGMGKGTLLSEMPMAANGSCYYVAVAGGSR